MAIYLYIAAVIALAVCAAYGLGRRAGYCEGRKTLQDEAPLIVREAALRAGACPICGTLAGEPQHRNSEALPSLISC